LANEKVCSDLVVFGEAFGSDIKEVLSALDPPPQYYDDDNNKTEIYSKRRSKMQSNHGNCFFVFVYEDNLLDWNRNRNTKNSNNTTLSNNNINTSAILTADLGINGGESNAFTNIAAAAADKIIPQFISVGHNWVIPVDRAIFPYESTSRNSNLFQYSSQFLFPDANTIVYQDIDFFLPNNLQKQPTNYHELYPHPFNKQKGK